MTTLKAVVFDCYETLVELPAAPRERAFDELASRLGVELAPGEAYRHWRERTTTDAQLRLGGHERPPLDGPRPPFLTFREVWVRRMRELFQHWGVDAPGEVGAQAYAGAHAGAPLYPDTRPALEGLRGGYCLAVLSDADDDFLHENLRRNGLAFDAVVTSEEMRAYKPHMSLFREMCRRLRIEPSEALHVGDSPWADIEGARHAGLHAVWLNRHGRGWPEDIRQPVAVIASLEMQRDLLPRVGL